MKFIKIILCLMVMSMAEATAQLPSPKLKSKKFKTTSGITVRGQVGTLTLPENPAKPNSRKIKIKFVRLKSLSDQPIDPIIYLEGGGGSATWQVNSPKDLNDWIPILEVADLIFIDRRGTNDQSLIHPWRKELPADLLVSPAVAQTHYEQMISEALPAFQKKGIDPLGYTVEQHARDVQSIATALGIKTFNLFAFSFGTTTSMALMEIAPEMISNAVLIGADAPHQAFNYPIHLDEHFEKVVAMAKQDSVLSGTIPDLQVLLTQVQQQLDKQPAEVTLKNPLTGKDLSLKVGSFGLNLILRLDLDDAYDIPIIPRLLYSIQQKNYELLTWFLQKRIAYLMAIPANGLNEPLSSGASEERWSRITAQAARSPFGNAVNFPFYLAKPFWPAISLSIDTSTPIQSNIRTLFVTGALDARTPIAQVNNIAKGFSQATHLTVRNAGHEQTLWNAVIFDQAIPRFLSGQDVSDINTGNRKIKFIPLTGTSDKHPALK